MIIGTEEFDRYNQISNAPGFLLRLLLRSQWCIRIPGRRPRTQHDTRHRHSRQLQGEEELKKNFKAIHEELQRL